VSVRCDVDVIDDVGGSTVSMPDDVGVRSDAAGRSRVVWWWRRRFADFVGDDVTDRSTMLFVSRHCSRIWHLKCSG